MKGRNLAFANNPPIIPVEVSQPLFDFQGFSQLEVVEMVNPRNNLSIFNANVMICLLSMLC